VAHSAGPPHATARPQTSADAATADGDDEAGAEPRHRGALAAVLPRPPLRLLPAWLVSLILHLMTLLVLALWIVQPPPEPVSLHLATAIGDQNVLGDEATAKDPLADAFEFDQPGSSRPAELPIEPVVAGNDAFAIESLNMDLPDPQALSPDVVSRSLMPVERALAGRMFAGRDPRLRAARLKSEGGTSFTEAAVARGLQWIARHQDSDGRWSLHGFPDAPGCRGKCSGAGTVESDVAATALALLPMLGAGQTHRDGQYAKEVRAGLNWLCRRQCDDGDLRGDDLGRSMYAHGLATIVLCEAYGLTRDESLQHPAQKALDFIVAAQHPAGGWRYEPGQEGDTSVMGWQLMALRSGQMAGLASPRRAFDKADRYLDAAQADSYGGLYSYLPHGFPTPTMTAEALLCRQYMGWPKGHSGLQRGVRYLMGNLPSPEETNVYYWYYATQVLYHLGGTPWERWNARMRVVLCAGQETEGHEAGSWTPRGENAAQGGRLYMTSLAVATLEVYYRYLPLYRPAALDHEGAAPNL
jgi:hypothetical protein